MRFNKLDLNLLVALDALLSENSISRAAEKVHLGQSAMSNALARLREYFDDELLVQVGRKMEPTPRALALKDPVRDVLIRVEAAVLLQPEFDAAQSDREFRLTVSDYTNAVLMPHLLALVHRQSLKVRFQLLPQVTNPQRALENGEVDLMIIPDRFAAKEHPAEQLFEESFCGLVWRESPLAHGELTLERYLNQGHVVMEPPQAKAFETQALAEMGIYRRVEVTTFSFATAPRLVVGTTRIATLHHRLALQAERMLPVVRRELPVRLPPMRQMMQWHKYRTNDPGIAWLRKTLHQAVQAMDQDMHTA
ncbi:LysR family transcriptional regulator [Hydrogenophaga sp. OTU3427]|jgi:LysR family transcriptional regulator, nod-box dependent transcriptional activator|uniref:LysR family transcriptional regulator n=1 Tax=Hydrogenophaga sp. OTU3427 TaxID=3043856 RepID=UPI00313D212C